MPLEVLSAPWQDYELLDSGNALKLERFGDRRLIREEPKAWWRPATGDEQWKRIFASCDRSGKWDVRSSKESRQWQLKLGEITFETRLTDMSKHVGVFPEQCPHWNWLTAKLKARPGARVLNLFGYTGAASLVAAAAGAQVTHVDASKPALAWARQNQALSGMENKPIRWLLDDAFRFVAREVRRGKTYDAILLDPPSFGRGPKGEVWKVEAQIVDFLHNMRRLLSDNPLCLVLTMYNLEASSIMLENLVRDQMPAGKVTAGELALEPKYGHHRLPLSLYARWENLDTF
jgi:23S rRNA (cytosine1962-C5)-methyltransferase